MRTGRGAPPSLCVLCVPDPLRAAVATSAFRVRISTGSSPLHFDARAHHFFSFFVFFILVSLSFLVFCPRALAITRQPFVTAHTLCRPHLVSWKKKKKKTKHLTEEEKNRALNSKKKKKITKARLDYDENARTQHGREEDSRARDPRADRTGDRGSRAARARTRLVARPIDAADAIVRLTGRSSPRTAAAAAADVFAARRAPVDAPSAITYCYTYPGALHVAGGEQQPLPSQTCCAHCCSPAAATAAATTVAAAAAAATAAYHHAYQQPQPPPPLHQYHQLAVAVTPQPKAPPPPPQHVGQLLYHLTNTYPQPPPPPTQQQQQQQQQQQVLSQQYLESIATAPPTATIATPAAAAVQDDVEMRGSDEMVTSPGVEGGPVSNGDTMGTNHVDNNNDAKKVKLDKTANNKPSRVIHIRNIPNEVTEAEVIHLGIPFGKVTNVLVLKGKNQAFLEMADETSASAMVAYFTTCTAQLRGRAVFIQFSNHKELKTDQTHSNANASAQAALQAAQALAGQSDVQGGPNTVLRVIVEHMVFPISLDVLYEIFSRYGKVLKIVTFTKNNSFQVLIQYPDVVTAQSAKLSLDGQNIYTSCCKLRIEYSKLSSLNVKYNNDKSRDYTNPTLPNGDNTVMETLAALGVDSVASNQLLPHQLSLLLSGVPNAAAGLPQARRQLTTNTDHSRLAGSPGMLTPSFNAVHGLASPLATSFANTPVTNMPLGFTLPGTTFAAGTLRLPNQMAGQTCVLLVSNLNEEMVTPDAIFTLFGVYGDVLRVKILYNKKDGALVQMAEPHQAHLAMLHLDKVRLYGKYIRVMQSKYQTVQLPKEGQPDSGLTKDYTSSPLHRFKKPGSKNYQNIYPPSSTLHLSNIPTTLSEDFLKTAFENNSFTVKDFKFFPKDRKMALIQMESLEEAVAALIKMHNYRLSEQNHLRVSFSKSNIQPDTLTPN